LGDAAGRRRVEALVTEGEATSRRTDASAAWAAMRSTLGLPQPAAIQSAEPLGVVPPLVWHRLDMAALSLDQLRGVFVTALDAGFELAAERAATALAARPDATPQDRWEAVGALVERAESSVHRLELIAQLRQIAAELKANDGMLDIAELRIRMQRGDEAEATRLLAHLQRDHGTDRQVLQALAEVLMEAGVDLNALAGARGGPAPTQAAAPAAAAGKLWTPGGEPPTAGGEKKTIWTPGG
jgi:thioredoxin-like negative regulator of GroEL